MILGPRPLHLQNEDHFKNKTKLKNKKAKKKAKKY